MMANPHRGQVPLVAGAATYALSMSINAMCALEAKLGRPMGAVMTDILAMHGDPARMSLTLLRAVLWAALQDHHAVDEAGAGDILGEAGLPAALGGVTQAFTLAFPAKKAGADARPQAAAG